MQFSTIVALVAGAVAVHAYPQSGTSFSEGGSCAVGTAASCCSSENAAGAGLLGLSNVLGGSCLLSDLLVGIGGNACSAGNTYCCPVDQAGLINVGATCLPITV